MEIDPEAYLDFDEKFVAKGGGGGGKPKRQGAGTIEAIAAEAKKNQLKNKTEDREGAEKSPVDEIQDVIDYVNGEDAGSVEMKNLSRYIDWLKANINSIDSLVVDKSEIGPMEKMTATLGAGGGGKDTSRNARRGTHLLTGIVVKSQDDRRAEPNIQEVIDKIKGKLQTHLRNWVTIMEVTRTQDDREKKKPIDLKKLEEEVLTRAAAKK